MLARPRSRPLRIVVLALALVGNQAYAQRYHVRTYSESDGLPSSTVNAIVQGADGRMWIATRSGVASYDGNTWSQGTLGDHPGEVVCGNILRDARGCLWATAACAGICVFHLEHDTWVALPELKEEEVGGITAAGTVTVAGQVHLVVGTDRGKIHVWDEAAWKSWDVVPEQVDRTIRCVESLGEKCLLATSSGVLVWSPSRPAQLDSLPGVPKEAVRSLAYDSATDFLWVVGHDWLGRLEQASRGEESRFQILVRDSRFVMSPDQPIFVAEPDAVGGVYFGSRAGLFHYHERTGLQTMRRRNGLITLGAANLCRDREGNVWVASFRGLSKIIDQSFASFDREHGLDRDEVTALLQRKSGEIVLGHGGSLSFLGRGRAPLRFAEDEVAGRVLDLAEDAEGTVWIAAEYVGLGRLGASGTLDWLEETENLGVTVGCLLVDRKNQLWVGSQTGIHRRVGEQFVTMEYPTTGQGSVWYPRCLHEGASGSIYVASAGEGVFCIHKEGTEQWKHPTVAGANSTFSFLERPDGTLWVGTAVGLYSISERTLEKVTTGPVIDRPVYFILEDAEDRTWFGTDHGVLRWDGQKLAHISVQDGLVGHETNRRASLLDDKGRVWIGTEAGVSVYDSILERPRTLLPTVELLSLGAAEATYSPDEPLSLAHDANSLCFRLRAISFLDEDRIRFRTRLEGLDSGWSPALPLEHRAMRYSGLQPGDYRFHVQAVDAEGRKSAPAVSASIEIRQPFWLQTWFVASASVLGLLLAWGLFSYADQRRYARRLEEEVRRRTDKLRHLEREQAKVQRLESLGIFAGGIAHDFNNLLTAILGNLSLLEEEPGLDSKRLQMLHGATAAASDARSLTRELMTFAKGGEPVRTTASISRVIRDAASYALTGSGVECTFDLPADLWSVEIDEGQMSQVVHNLLINAREAMPGGGTIEIRAHNSRQAPAELEEGLYVTVVVKDHGIGIPESQLSLVFDPYFSTKSGGTGLGLASAHSIVERHGGLLRVCSEVGEGSVFQMDLPATGELLSRPKQPLQKPSRPTQLRVLVMDDEPMLCDLYQRMLASLGHLSSTTANGEEALAAYRSAAEQGEPFDLVIMDLTVPGGMGGSETVQAMLTFDPQARVVAASGYSEDPVMARHAEHGFRNCLHKPFGVRDLARILDQSLAGDEVTSISDPATQSQRGQR